eukprot:6615564-Alexandrium_andersonii.AAC.1
MVVLKSGPQPPFSHVGRRGILSSVRRASHREGVPLGRAARRATLCCHRGGDPGLDLRARAAPSAGEVTVAPS